MDGNVDASHFNKRRITIIQPEQFILAKITPFENLPYKRNAQQCQFTLNVSLNDDIQVKSLWNLVLSQAETLLKVRKLTNVPVSANQDFNVDYQFVVDGLNQHVNQHQHVTNHTSLFAGLKKDDSDKCKGFSRRTYCASR